MSVGNQNEEEVSAASLDDDIQLQNEILEKLRTHNSKGKANRMAEVQNARDQRLYFRGIQQFYWSEDREDVIFESEDDSPYDRTFNVIQGYGKIFIAAFMGAKTKVRPEADDPFDPASIRNTSKAATYERVYRKYNDPASQQRQIASIFWTDGRVITRLTQRDGREVTEFWGVLEARVSITAKEDPDVPLKNCALIELEDEYPIVQLKRDYGDKKDAKGEELRKKINSGNGDSYERNARTSVKRQAGTDTSIDVMSGEDSYGLATKTWSYMRPEFFEEFKEATRSELQAKFPAGLCVVHNGEVYLESYACDIDSCLDVIHALPGDGQSRGSIGQSCMPLQDSVNTGQNLIEETLDHGIPTIYYDTKTDIDGLNKQREMPGASRKANGLAGYPLSNAFYSTPTVNPSQQLIEYVENVKGPQMQFSSALPPAIFGSEMQDQKTASGYAQARSQALGQMAIVWNPFTAWKTREMTRAVKMASQGTEEMKTTLPAQRKGGNPEAVKIQPGELQGLSFTNDSDENFPETWTEKSNKFMSLLQMGGEVSDWLLTEEPDNMYFAKQMIGLEELVIPGEDLRNNVLADIASIEHEPPQPDPNQMPQQALPQMGQPPVPPPMVSSVQIDTQFLEDKDFEVGWKTVKHWVNSAAGQEAKISNPMWWQNVRLYGLQYKQGMEAAQAAAQQAAMPPPPPPPPPQEPKPMGITANWKDLPEDAQVQALARDNIQVNPATVGQNKQVPKVGATA